MPRGRRTRRLFSRNSPSLPSSPQRQEDGRESKDEKEKPHLTTFLSSEEILWSFQFMIRKSLMHKDALISNTVSHSHREIERGEEGWGEAHVRGTLTLHPSHTCSRARAHTHTHTHTHSGVMLDLCPVPRFSFLVRAWSALSLTKHVIQILTIRVRLPLQRGFA